MSAMTRGGVLLFLTLLLLLSGSLSSAAVSPSPSRVVNGFLSNAVSKLMKWFRSFRATTKTVASSRPMVKFESGYTVETVFDGSKLGIEPHTVEVLPSGELLILDSANSNLYKISSALSQHTRPRLIVGSADGYFGHVDGKTREARLNHPKGLTVDDKGNIYIADADNMAIRKISETGVTTIAGGKWSRGGMGHVDGPSEDAKFSTDFDVVYIGSSCSLLVIDRGNQAVREIQLHFDDCAYQYESSFPLGIVVLLAAGFFGYMLALLQRRVGSIVSAEKVEKTAVTYNPYEKRVMASSATAMRPRFPHDGPEEKQEETILGSMGKLAVHVGECLVDIFGSIFPKRKQQGWQAQDSYVIQDGDEPPSIDSRSPTPLKMKNYAFMTEAEETAQKLKWGAGVVNGILTRESSELYHPTRRQQHLNHHNYLSAGPETVFEQSPERKNEVLFGAAVQEADGTHGYTNNYHYGYGYGQ